MAQNQRATSSGAPLPSLPNHQATVCEKAATSIAVASSCGMSLSAAAETLSEHPLGKAVVRGFKQRYSSELPAGEIAAGELSASEPSGGAPHIVESPTVELPTAEAFSMTLNFVAIALAITGILNPVVGALVHSAGSVVVIVNSTFLLKWKSPKRKLL